MKRSGFIVGYLVLMVSCASQKGVNTGYSANMAELQAQYQLKMEQELKQRNAYNQLDQLLRNHTIQEQWAIINDNLELTKLAWGSTFNYNYWNYESWKTGKWAPTRPEPKEELTPEAIAYNQYLDKNSFFYDSDYRKAMDVSDKNKYIQAQMLLWADIDSVATKQQTTNLDCSKGYPFWRAEYFRLQQIVLKSGYNFSLNRLLIESCDEKWQTVAELYSIFKSAGVNFDE